jgi:hypothetical protein
MTCELSVSKAIHGLEGESLYVMTTPVQVKSWRVEAAMSGKSLPQHSKKKSSTSSELISVLRATRPLRQVDTMLQHMIPKTNPPAAPSLGLRSEHSPDFQHQ